VTAAKYTLTGRLARSPEFQRLPPRTEEVRKLRDAIEKCDPIALHTDFASMEKLVEKYMRVMSKGVCVECVDNPEEVEDDKQD